MMERPGVYHWNFDMDGLVQNLNQERQSQLPAWNSHFGLWGGRNQFYFSDHSRWVHLATNTLAMMKVCPTNRGFREDIFAFQSDESPANHWMYEHSGLSDLLAMRMSDFLNRYDGVNVLNSERAALYNEFVNDRIKTRGNDEFNYQNY